VRIAIVSGAVANKCRNGGETWVRLSWIAALKKLGFSTYFVEQIDRDECTDANGNRTGFHESENVSYFRKVMEDFGLTETAGLICTQGAESVGIQATELPELGASAEVLINISGHLPFEMLKQLKCPKVYVDIDPGFTQCWQAAGTLGSRLEGHDFYFTIGENIGLRCCSIPTNGLHWRSTRQPVVLNDWPVVTASDRNRFTTVASWRGSFGPVTYQRRTYGLKVHEFRKLIELPSRAEQTFEIALNIHPADQKDIDLLHNWGWRIVDPASIACHPYDFRKYVQQSGAEFSVAQGIYVETNSGWFSDRTVRYLASGKPTLVQETGFRDHLPVGEGLVSFQNLEDAIHGARSIGENYERHSAAARNIAEQYFESDRVLGRMLEEIDVRT